MFRFVTEQARSVGTFVAKVLSPRGADHGIRSELDTALSSSKVEERIGEATANSPHQVTDPKALDDTFEEAADVDLADAELADAELAGAELAENPPTPKLSPQTPGGNGELEADAQDGDAGLKDGVETAAVAPSPNTRPKTPTPEPRSAKRGKNKAVKPPSAKPRTGRKGKSEAKQVPVETAVVSTPKSKKRASEAEPKRTPKKSKRASDPEEGAGKAEEELVTKGEEKETARNAQTPKEEPPKVEKEQKAQSERKATPQADKTVTPKAAKKATRKAEKKRTPKAEKKTTPKAGKKVTPKAERKEATAAEVPEPEKKVGPKAEKKVAAKPVKARKKQLPLTEGTPKKRSITEVLQKLEAEETKPPTAEEKEAPAQETGVEGPVEEKEVKGPVEEKEFKGENKEVKGPGKKRGGLMTPSRKAPTKKRKAGDAEATPSGKTAGRGRAKAAKREEGLEGREYIGKRIQVSRALDVLAALSLFALSVRSAFVPIVLCTWDGRRHQGMTREGRGRSMLGSGYEMSDFACVHLYQEKACLSFLNDPEKGML